MNPVPKPIHPQGRDDTGMCGRGRDAGSRGGAAHPQAEVRQDRRTWRVVCYLAFIYGIKYIISFLSFKGFYSKDNKCKIMNSKGFKN